VKKIAVIAALCAFGGCATAQTTTMRMDYQSLNNFKIDCAHKQEQIDFLRSQLLTTNETIINAYTITSTLGYLRSNLDGTYQDRRKMFDNSHKAIINAKIDQLIQYCH
jgi:hypothetical protein